MHCKRRSRCLCNCFTPTRLYGHFVQVWTFPLLLLQLLVFCTYAPFVLHIFFICVCVCAHAYRCNLPFFPATFPYILTMMMTTNSCAKTCPLCSKLHSYSPTTHDIFWQLFLLTAYHKTSLSARRLLFIITYIAP